MSTLAARLMEIHDTLLNHYGPQGWWPAHTAPETIMGAILVQHAGWQNVEKAIANLKAGGLLDFERIDAMDAARLAEMIRPAGMPKIKAKRLKALARWLGGWHDFDLDSLLATPMEALREDLLTVKGIGPETADCILLYAAKKPSFVVDTYTWRILTRHLLAEPECDYDELKELFESSLPPDVSLFNEFHALLVEVGKKHCKPAAACQSCPLEHLEHRVE